MHTLYAVKGFCFSRAFAQNATEWGKKNDGKTKKPLTIRSWKCPYSLPSFVCITNFQKPDQNKSMNFSFCSKNYKHSELIYWMITFYSDDDIFALIYNSQHALSTITALCLCTVAMVCSLRFCVCVFFFFSWVLFYFVIVWLMIISFFFS